MTTQYIGYFGSTGLSNIYFIVELGQTIWNGTAMETFDAGNQDSYGTYMTDTNSIGYYTAAVPVGLPLANYVVLVYQQSGGSIDLTVDTQLGSQNLELLVSPATSSLIPRLRILTGDYADSNKIYNESANPVTNGTRTAFKLQSQGITSGSVYWSDATNNRASNDITVDCSNGIVVFGTAPADGVGLTFDYTFEWFTDIDYQEFLTQSANALIYASPDLVPVGLQPALMQFGVYYFNMKRAEAYAHRFASSGGTASESVSTVTGEYQKLAQMAYKNACSLRDAFYTSAGQQKSPAYGQSRTQMDPYTPRR